MKVLVVRTDRLGDVLLTTPLAGALKAQDRSTEVTFLVRPYAAPLLAQNPDIDRVIEDRGGLVSELSETLRAAHFDAAVIAYPRWRAAWAVWRAGIPLRIGPASKPYSLLFNRRLWQHRSEGAQHEADYNLELLQPLGIAPRRFPTRFVLTDEEKQTARKTLQGHRLSFQKPVVILHPGSGGSSARWPLQFFMELGDRLQEEGCDVVVTGGPGEDYQYLMIDNMRRIPVFIAAGSVSVRELGALLSQADLFVSNSTGPLHLAVALDVPTVSVYSPVPTCHPKRWGPYPAFVDGNPKHQVALAPDQGLPEADMRQVSVESVLGLCRSALRTRLRVEAGNQ